MKVKIRGLVFVGFAAAVFAQSAMADANDAKTVTSKLYVDNYAQEQAKRVKIGTDGGTNEFTSLEANNFPWTSNDDYPSMKVLKEVKDSLGTAANIGGANYTTRVDVTDGSNNVTGHNIVLDETKLTTNLTTDAGTIARGEASGADQTQQDAAVAARAKLATTGAVYNYAEANANKATAIITSGTGQNNTTATDGDVKYPTTKAVYDFVTTQGGNYQPKVTTASATTMYVGKYVPDDPTTTGTNEEQVTWDKLTTGTYVSNTSSTAGTYTLDIPAAQIAASGDFVASNGSNDAARAKLATSGTVYDFVNTNYQAKSTGTAVQVGYNDGWTTLAGGDSYVNVAYNSASGHTQAEVTLTNLTSGTSEFVASNGSNDATRGKLAKSGDVYDFVTGLTGGLTIPTMPEACTTAAEAGGYCALVYGVSSGTAGQQGATYALQWTVMAPVPETSGNGGE